MIINYLINMLAAFQKMKTIIANGKITTIHNIP